MHNGSGDRCAVAVLNSGPLCADESPTRLASVVVVNSEPSRRRVQAVAACQRRSPFCADDSRTIMPA